MVRASDIPICAQEKSHVVMGIFRSRADLEKSTSDLLANVFLDLACF